MPKFLRRLLTGWRALLFVIGKSEPGMDAIYAFDAIDMQATVAVDAGGTRAHITWWAIWHKKIATGKFRNVAVTAS